MIHFHKYLERLKFEDRLVLECWKCGKRINVLAPLESANSERKPNE